MGSVSLCYICQSTARYVLKHHRRVEAHSRASTTPSEVRLSLLPQAGVTVLADAESTAAELVTIGADISSNRGCSSRASYWSSYLCSHQSSSCLRSWVPVFVLHGVRAPHLGTQRGGRLLTFIMSLFRQWCAWQQPKWMCQSPSTVLGGARRPGRDGKRSLSASLQTAR